MFDNVGLAEVESELVGLAGQLAAGTCRFLQLLAEFDDRDGWAGPGLRSCAHWLNWRVGLDLRTAREQLRVAHALRPLPMISAAFAAGRVSYSKVRALTRVASANNEEALLSVALHGTAAQVEELVRAARAGADPRTAAARRGLWWSSDVDGSVVLRLRVPAEGGHRLIAAITAHLDAAEPADRPDDAATGAAAVAGDDWRAERDESIARTGEHAPGAVVEPVAARRLDALLDLVTGEQAVSPAKVVVHLRLDQPETSEDETSHDETSDDGPPVRGGEPTVATAWFDDGPVIPAATAERISCTAEVAALLVDRRGNPLYLGRTRRTVTPAQLLALRARDGHRCRFPGCRNSRFLEAHHVIWCSLGGPTDLDNLILICPFHHGLIHDHGYSVRSTGDGGFAFTRPDATPVPRAGPPTRGRVEDLLAAQTALAIDDWTITPRWGGERLDRDIVLRWLVPELRESQQGRLAAA